MIPRRIARLVEDRLRHMPAVVLIGPRQVGKTTLARQLAAARGPRAMYLDLERPADRRRLADPDAFLRAQAGKLVVVDEIHRAPDLFAPLRGIIDDRRAAASAPGTSSFSGPPRSTSCARRRNPWPGASPPSSCRHSTRGRSRMPGSAIVDRLWVRGGFPESLLADTDEDSLVWRQSFAAELPGARRPDVRAAAARRDDRPALDDARPRPGQHAQPGAAGLEPRRVGAGHRSLRRSARRPPARSPPAPWSGNVGKRLVRSPKVYVRDSGLVHALLELETWEDVLGHPVAGPSWEGFAIENLIAAAGERRTPSFYRTEDGAEVDLVFERGGYGRDGGRDQADDRPVRVTRDSARASTPSARATRISSTPGARRGPPAAGSPRFPWAT